MPLSLSFSHGRPIDHLGRNFLWLVFLSYPESYVRLRSDLCASMVFAEFWGGLTPWIKRHMIRLLAEILRCFCRHASLNHVLRQQRTGSLNMPVRVRSKCRPLVGWVSLGRLWLVSIRILWPVMLSHGDGDRLKQAGFGGWEPNRLLIVTRCCVDVSMFTFRPQLIFNSTLFKVSTMNLRANWRPLFRTQLVWVALAKTVELPWQGTGPSHLQVALANGGPLILYTENGETTCRQLSKRLPDNSTIFAAEATAISLALNYYRHMGPVHHDVVVYSDSMSCLQAN